MPIDMLLLVATLCTLLATPWRAAPLASSMKATYLLALAGASQIAVLLGRMPGGSILGVVLAGLWSLRNCHTPGATFLLIGLLGNGLAMAMYGGAMPLAPAVAAELGISSGTLLAGSKDVIGDGRLWTYLGDWLLVRTPWSVIVLSPGDLCIFAALVRWSSARRRAAAAQGSSYPDAEPGCRRWRPT